MIEGKYPDSRGNPYNMATRLDISDNYVDFFIGGDLIGKVPLNGTLKNTKSGRARCHYPDRADTVDSVPYTETVSSKISDSSLEMHLDSDWSMKCKGNRHPARNLHSSLISIAESDGACKFHFTDRVLKTGNEPVDTFVPVDGQCRFLNVSAVDEKVRVATTLPPLSPTGRDASGKPGEQPANAQPLDTTAAYQVNNGVLILILATTLGASLLLLYFLREKGPRHGGATGPSKSAADEPSLGKAREVVSGIVDAPGQRFMSVGWDQLKQLQANEQPASDGPGDDHIRRATDATL